MRIVVGKADTDIFALSMSFFRIESRIAPVIIADNLKAIWDILEDYDCHMSSIITSIVLRHGNK